MCFLCVLASFLFDSKIFALLCVDCFTLPCLTLFCVALLVFVLLCLAIPCSGLLLLWHYTVLVSGF